MRPNSIRLKPRLRATFYAVFGLLFLSGFAWWIVRIWARPSGEADSVPPSPWEPWLLKTHGAAAMAALVLFGILYLSHILRGWRARRNRFTGSGLVAVCLLLVVTGYLLYYSGGDTARAVVSLLHLWLGLAFPIIIVTHIWRGRATRR